MKLQGVTIGDVVKERREDANAVKDCYTKFAFQVLVVAIAFLGFLGSIFKMESHCGFTCVAVSAACFTVGAVLLCVAQIGCHKYSTANRHNGFELHLNRTYDYEKYGSTIEENIRNVGWEEAMCAWRIVQPILYEGIYMRKTFWEKLMFPVEGIEYPFSNEYHWWDSGYLVNTEPDGKLPLEKTESFPYHPGSYLKNTQGIIHIICVLISMVGFFYYSKGLSYLVHSFSEQGGLCFFSKSLKGGLILIHLLFGIFYLFYVAKNIALQYAKRLILERGLLSIQSCAVVWRMVVIAHLTAVQEGFNAGMDYQGYTRRLALKGKIFRDNKFNIHNTIMKGRWPE